MAANKLTISLRAYAESLADGNIELTRKLARRRSWMGTSTFEFPQARIGAEIDSVRTDADAYELAPKRADFKVKSNSTSGASDATLA